MEHEPQPKWEGKICSKLKGTKAEQIWPFLEDFFGLHKWSPTIDTCRHVDGVAGQPGCIRYCAVTADETTKWATERLVAIDRTDRCLSYEIVENNMGLNSYVATMKVKDDGDGDEGCMIEWSFVMGPIEGWRLEDFVSLLNTTLEGMTNRMVEALSATK